MISTQLQEPRATEIISSFTEHIYLCSIFPYISSTSGTKAMSSPCKPSVKRQILSHISEPRPASRSHTPKCLLLPIHSGDLSWWALPVSPFTPLKSLFFLWIHDLFFFLFQDFPSGHFTPGPTARVLLFHPSRHVAALCNDGTLS